MYFPFHGVSGAEKVDDRDPFCDEVSITETLVGIRGYLGQYNFSLIFLFYSVFKFTVY